MWNVKRKVVPVIIGATGTLRQYPSNIPGKQKLRNYQKQPYWALHIYYEECYVKVQNIFHGRNNITCSTNCKYRTASTLYTLET